jgi:penicillin amidase
MNGAERRARTIFHTGNRVVALAVSACLLALLGLGMGGVPALGRMLVPGHGAWRSSAAATLPVAHTLTLPGLSGAVGGNAVASSGAISWELRA